LGQISFLAAVITSAAARFTHRFSGDRIADGVDTKTPDDSGRPAIDSEWRRPIA
jgi:hypothetical protein